MFLASLGGPHTQQVFEPAPIKHVNSREEEKSSPYDFLTNKFTRGQPCALVKFIAFSLFSSYCKAPFLFISGSDLEICFDIYQP